MFNDLVFAHMMKLMKNEDKNLVNIEVYAHLNNPLIKISCVPTDYKSL